MLNKCSIIKLLQKLVSRFINTVTMFKNVTLIKIIYFNFLSFFLRRITLGNKLEVSLPAQNVVVVVIFGDHKMSSRSQE